MKSSTLTIIFLSALCCLMSCSKDDEPQRAKPVFTSFAPVNALPGKTVTITGENFSSVTTENSVQFNGVQATVTAATATQLSATVPSTATTGKISVTVANLSATSAINFEVLVGQGISSISPAQGLPGSTITITGQNFRSAMAENTVKLNGVLATITSATTTELKVIVPQTTSGKVTVEVFGTVVTSAADFEVLKAPVITSFSPAQGLQGSTLIITGQNFRTTLAENTVKLNGVLAIVSSASATELRIAVPATTVGKVSVEIFGTVVTSTTDFEVIKAPIINAFSPTYSTPGATLTITGQNFRSTIAENSVKVNGASATITSATTTELKITVPGTTTGKVSVDIFGNVSTSSADFEVLKDFPRNGLIGYWPFTGDGLEKGLNNTGLTFPLETTINPSLATDRFGNTNSAVQFNGIQSSSIGQVITNQPWTISTWIDPGVFNNPVMGFMESNSGSRYLVFNFTNNTTGDFYITGQGDDGTESTHGNYYDLVGSPPSNRYIPNSAVDNNWMNITMMYDGTVFKIYKDNQEVYTNTVSTQTPMPAIFTIGKTYNTYYYIGKMDDLIIYNRALSATERTQVFMQTISKH